MVTIELLRSRRDSNTGIAVISLDLSAATTKTVARRDAVRQRQILGQPLVLRLGPAMNGRRTTRSTQNATNADDDNVY